MIKVKVYISISDHLDKGAHLDLGGGHGVVERDEGEKVFFKWDNGDDNFVFRSNILSAYKWAKVKEKYINYE